MLTIMNVLVLLTVPLELFMDGFDAFSQHMLLCLARFSRSQSHAEVPTTVIQQQERNEEMTEPAQAVDNRTEADSGGALVHARVSIRMRARTWVHDKTI